MKTKESKREKRELQIDNPYRNGVSFFFFLKGKIVKACLILGVSKKLTGIERKPINSNIFGK